MTAQRVRGAGNRAGIQLVKWTAEGFEEMTVRIVRVFGDVWHTLVAGDMSVSLKEHSKAVNQGGTADKLIIRP